MFIHPHEDYCVGSYIGYGAKTSISNPGVFRHLSCLLGLAALISTVLLESLLSSFIQPALACHQDVGFVLAAADDSSVKEVTGDVTSTSWSLVISLSSFSSSLKTFLNGESAQFKDNALAVDPITPSPPAFAPVVLSMQAQTPKHLASLFSESGQS